MNPSRTALRIASAFLAVALVSTSLLAQGVTTAAMNGTVTDRAGASLPGVNIIATHVPSGTQYGTTSRPNGKFNLPGMRVGGPYSVTASLIGYAKQTRSDLYLQLSQNLDLNFSLVEEAVQAPEVVVTGQRAAVFNASRNGAATNVSREQIDRLPTLSRSFQDYYRLSPYVTSEKGNVAGRNSRYNNIQVDGTNFNDMFGLGSTGAPAGQSNVTPISLDAIEEFQMVVSPYDIRQGGFTGAGVNVITRSGTNNYTGSAFYFGRNENFVGKSPDDLKTKLPGFTDYQLGGRFGGPIIKDKLFFFANAEMTRFSQPFSRTFGNQELGTNAYTVNPDSLEMLSAYLKSKYGYDPGSYTNIGYNRESDKMFLRFDFNLAENHKLTARWNYLRSSEDNSPSRGRSVTDIYFDNGKYKLDDKTHNLALQLTSVFSNAASNELIVGYVDQMDQPIYYGQPFPALYIETKGTNTKYTGIQNLVLGAEQFRHYNLLSQKYLEVTNNFSWYLPNHTLVFGVKADLFQFRNLFISDGFGTYGYRSIAQFLKDGKPDGNTALNTSGYSFRYSATSDPQQEANWGANQFGLYVQDEWTLSPTFKVIAGLRADIPTYPDKPNYNKAIDSTFGYRTDVTPKTTVALSPRVGFNWAIDQERISQLRGGIGVFYGRFPYVWVSNQYSNTGVDFYTSTTAPSKFIPDPYGQPKLATSLPSAEVDLTATDFKAPSVLRWNLAWDYKLTEDITATLEGIFSVNINDVYYQNINLKGLQDNSGVLSNRPALTPGGYIVGEGRQVWGKFDTTATRYTTQWVNAAQFSPGVFLIRNVSRGSNANVIAQIQRNAPIGLNGLIAYTWGMAKDVNSMNSTTASSGWRFNPTQGDPNSPTLTYSQWDRRHRFMAAVSYIQDWGGGYKTNLGFVYNAMSGRPFSYMVSGDVNGDGRSDNDLAYIPKNSDDIILTNSAGTRLLKNDPAYTQLWEFIEGDDYLKEYRGHISERSGPREPWAHTLDMRIAQEIPTFRDQRIEITLDVLNVLNLLNSDWGWVKNTGTNQTVNLMTFKGLEKTVGPDYGKPKYQWSGLKTTDGVADPFQPDNILSRWQMQLGIRYTL